MHPLSLIKSPPPHISNTQNRRRSHNIRCKVGGGSVGGVDNTPGSTFNNLACLEMFANGVWISILNLQYFGHLMQRTDSLGKDPDAGKDWRQEAKGTTEDETVGWHHRLSGHEFEQARGDGEGQGSLVCWSPWGCKELDMTEGLNIHSELSSIRIA